MSTEQIFDPSKAEAFAGHMLGVINGGFTTVAVSMGNRTGLFEAMADLPASTSSQIADKANLNERYVREWLGTMVTGKIVEYDPSAKTYFLPPEHAAFLTKAAGPDNLAVFAKSLPLIGITEDQIAECFFNGGGVPYAQFGQCLHCISEMTGPFVDKFLLESQLPLAPGLVERLESGIDVLDIGCGHGHAINVMAKAFPKSRFTGYDLVEDSITHAREEANAYGNSNTRFEVKDVAALDEAEQYDLITAFDSIHDQAKPRTVLKGVHRALRPGGVFFMVDINASSNLEENLDHLLGPTFYTMSFSHCMTVSLAYGGEGLGTMWGRQKAVELLKEAGFPQTEIKDLQGDLMNCYYISLKE